MRTLKSTILIITVLLANVAYAQDTKNTDDEFNNSNISADSSIQNNGLLFESNEVISPKEKIKVRLSDRPSKSEDTRIAAKISAFVVLGIVNPAVEFKIFKNATVQLEALGIFANTNFLGTGKPLELGAGFGEIRYYIKRAFDGLYAGACIGFGTYKINKGLVFRYMDKYKGDYYQQGTNIMTGLTIGYQYNISKHWSLEFSWSGGFQHSKYEGYEGNKSTDPVEVEKHPYVMYVENNGSAEWPPMFKCGLFVGYRF